MLKVQFIYLYYFSCLNRHLCDLREAFGKKHLNLVIVFREVFSEMCSVKCVPHGVSCKMCSAMCVPWNVFRKVCSAKCVPQSVFCKMFSMKCVPRSVPWNVLWKLYEILGLFFLKVVLILIHTYGIKVMTFTFSVIWWQGVVQVRIFYLEACTSKCSVKCVPWSVFREVFHEVWSVKCVLRNVFC